MTRPSLDSPEDLESTTGQPNGRHLPATLPLDALPGIATPVAGAPPAAWALWLRGPGLALAVQVVALAFIAWPWVRPDLLWNDVADAPNHLVRIFAVDAALGQGQGYPRWLGDLYLGYGYPLLNYYAPGLYYLGAALHRLGLTVYASLQWAGVLAAAAGAAGAYALTRAMTGRRDASVVASVAFVLAPYPFLTNLYVRAALPEALALGLLPWLLLAGWRALYRPGRWGARWATLALAALSAALLLTHNISALIGFGLLTGWLLLLPLVEGRPSGGAAWRTAGAVALGFAVAAFFWLPALSETGAVQLNLAQGGLYDPQNWLYDPAGGGARVARAEYRHTRPGPADLSLIFDYNALGGFMPEKISLGQFLLAVATAGVAVAVLWRRPHSRPARLALLWTGLGVICWFFNTTWSSRVWDVAPLLPLVQFPWRFYGPLALCVALGAGAALAALAGLPRRRAVALAGGAGAAGLVLLLAIGAVATRPYRLGPLPAHDVDERNLAGLEYNRYGAGTTSGGEFLPRTAAWGEDGNRRGIKVYDDAYPQAGWQAGLVRVLDGEGAATAVYQAPGWIAARVEAATPVRLAVHQLLFPGWRAYLDGQPAPLGTTPRLDAIGGSLGIMVLDVPAGQHHVEVRFAPTPPRAAGAALTSAALALVYVLWGTALQPEWLRRRRRGALVALPVLAAALSLGAGAWDARPRLGPADAGPGAYARVPLGIGLGGASRVWIDVAGAVAGGRAETAAPGFSGQGNLQPYLDVRYQGLPGPPGVAGTETRRWLYMHPPAAAAVRLRVPPHAYFQAGLGLDPAVWGQGVEYGDGVRFVLEVDGPAGRQVLLDRHVNPRARTEERPWIDVWVDLDHLAGQEVRLTLRAESADDPNFDWAGWANPQIVTWPAARAQPGARHQW